MKKVSLLLALAFVISFASCKGGEKKEELEKVEEVVVEEAETAVEEVVTEGTEEVEAAATEVVEEIKEETKE